jgi:23S rRNA (cytidine2498-2'-O)-methyltransferase
MRSPLSQREQQVGYLAPEGFLDELREELGDSATDVRGRLVLTSGPAKRVAWASNVWYDPLPIPISSIGDAVKKLRSVQRCWTLYSHALHRRATLISEKLPKVAVRPIAFGTPTPRQPLGSWTLIDEHTVVASPHCSSPFPNGTVRFVEDRTAPPSRAYLKLWELFTILGQQPKPGEFCLDLGASPGGWTWVLQQLGARVLSVDRSALDDRIAALSGIEYRRGDAFTFDPHTLGPIDWLFSDVICYPERLFLLVQKWLAAGNVRRFVCTIKFQGRIDFATMRRFEAIPQSRLVHLHHNKRELTWIKL